MQARLRRYRRGRDLLLRHRGNPEKQEHELELARTLIGKAGEATRRPIVNFSHHKSSPTARPNNIAA